ncbi:hypothetical protein MPSEU_000802600 [Mayamaea pseudoterrestris]|nr:hypothetical protein MPSEU_000802600 [Mayamaea pseudoterrestris]
MTTHREASHEDDGDSQDEEQQMSVAEQFPNGSDANSEGDAAPASDASSSLKNVVDNPQAKAPTESIIQASADPRQSNISERGGICYRLITKNRCLWRCLKSFPRITALCYGVLLPLGLLVVLATLVGLMLAKSEAPNEVHVNDKNLENTAKSLSAAMTLGEITSRIPKLCMNLFFFNDTQSHNLTEKLSDYILKASQDSNSFQDVYRNDQSSSGSMVTINTTDLYEFMKECGQAATPAVEQLFRKLKNSTANSASMTFNWIRCFPGARGIESLSVPWLTRSNLSEIQPQAQRDLFTQTWWADQQQLYQQHLNASIASGDGSDPVNLTKAKLHAYQQSIDQATGGTACELNAAASGWFWFIILSTVGYGNQNITTAMGRRIVYVLGFLSILAFGAILSTAGYVVASIVDDALVRYKLRFLTRTWTSCFLWGGLYILSMLSIASFTTRWKHERLDGTASTFTLSDGYWFGYISSTSIGLGDIFLEPEVFLGIDLVTFPMLFLFSFVLASAFIAKFVHWVVSVVGKRSILENLLTELKTIDPLK